MRFFPNFLFLLLIIQLTSAGEVDVIEPSSDEIKVEHREDVEPNPDQIALESLNDRTNEQLPPKLSFNGPPSSQPRKPINLPPRDHPSGHYPHKPPPPPFGGHLKNKPNFEKNSYNGPPPPPPKQAMDKYGNSGGPRLESIGNEIWPAPAPEMPKIVSLDVKCEKNSMKVYLSFDKPFYGIVFSKGHYSNVHCVHLPAGLGRTSAQFEIGIHACGTSGNTENGLYGYGAESGSGTYFENIIVIQYDPQVQEVWDQARKLRCTWHDQYEKSVTFKPFPVDMLDVVRTDFAGDNVGCWMQIQVGKGPWAAEVKGLVKIGQTMTMVLAIKDDDFKFDMLVRNCMAHDGKRAPIQLVDQRGCVTRPKLMSRFTKIKNFGSSASVLSFAHFQAFKFPDSMEVHFQCTIQICRYQCPDQCAQAPEHQPELNNAIDGYGPPPPPPLEAYLHSGRPRDHLHERRDRRSVEEDPEKEIGLNRVIRVVSTGDLTFSLDDNSTSSNAPTMVFPAKDDLNSGLICMTTPGFAAALVVLLSIMTISCLLSAFLFMRLRPFSSDKLAVFGYRKGKTSTVESSLSTTLNSSTLPASRSCFYS